MVRDDALADGMAAPASHLRLESAAQRLQRRRADTADLVELID